jgi:hypothetical protein
MTKLKYWKKGNELHLQEGMNWGNDLTCVEDGEMGTYIPLTDEEHLERGFKEISFDEACKMAEIAGYDVGEDED